MTGTEGNCPSLLSKKNKGLSFEPETFFENPISTYLKLAFGISITSCYKNRRPDASTHHPACSKGVGGLVMEGCCTLKTVMVQKRRRNWEPLTAEGLINKVHEGRCCRDRTIVSKYVQVCAQHTCTDSQTHMLVDTDRSLLPFCRRSTWTASAHLCCGSSVCF